MSDENPKKTGEGEPTQEKKKRPLVMVVVLVALLANGAFAAKMMLGGGDAEAAEVADAELEQNPEVGESGPLSDSAPLGPTASMDTFVVNLANDQARYFRVAMTFELAPETDTSPFEEREAILRDRIISHLSGMFSEDLITQDDKDNLRSQLVEIASTVSPETPIRRVFFTDYIVQ